MPRLSEAALERLAEAERRYEVVGEELSDPATFNDGRRAADLGREQAELAGVVDGYQRYRALLDQIEQAEDLLRDGAEEDLRDLARQEIAELEPQVEQVIARLDEFLRPRDPNDQRDVIMEIRGAEGGQEANLWAADLMRMYMKYAELKGWKVEVLNTSETDLGGIKEVIFELHGRGAYSRLKYEGGGHRVQRVPETEAQGRIHTSMATVAVLPEMPDVQIHIDPKDVEEFGCRGGGPGGQNVNKVETGWFIRHKPSGLTFKMTEHKSQAQNKERAWALLRATLYEAERAKQHAAERNARKTMMGSGDRSQRIRTYNFPQNRCTDHRLGGEGGGEKNFNLDQIMAGNLDPLIAALLDLDKQQRLEN